MGRILVVDDDRLTVSAMTKLLRQDGHEVAPFVSGREAVGALRAAPFDVVICDFEMPSADGLAVARAARESSPDACIVGTHRGRAGPSIGTVACVVLEKPIQYDAVHRAIAACLAGGGHRGASCARRVACA